ncbi:hypothetical protein BH20VER3_BH20VER3_01000 [soil metagenome]
MASEIKVKVGLQGGALASGLTKIKAQFSEFRSHLNSSLGNLVAFGAIEEGLRRLIEKGSRISDLADRFGVSTEALQRFGNVAEQDGSSLEAVAKAFNRLTVAREDAQRGLKDAIDSFKGLGVTMEEIKNLSVEELFYKIGDAVANASDQSTAYANVTKLMGRSAGELIPTFQRGSAAIREQGQSLGVLSDETVRSLDKIGDELSALKNRLFVFGGALITFFAKIGSAIGETFGTAINTAERSVATLGKALDLALHGHFVDAGKALAAGVKDNVKDTLREAAAIRKEVANAFKDVGHEAFGLGAGSGKKPVEPPVRRGVGEERAAAPDAEAREKRIAALREQLAEIQRKAGNDQLDTEAKINALIEQRAELLKQAEAAADPEKKLKLQIDAANLAKEIFAAQKQLDASLESKGRVPSVAASSLRRIGGGTGGFESGGSDALREQRLHTTLLKQIEANTKAKQEIALKMQ